MNDFKLLGRLCLRNNMYMIVLFKQLLQFFVTMDCTALYVNFVMSFSLLLLLSPCSPRFFEELNSQVLRAVLDAASSEDHVMTMLMVGSVGLHPVKDRLFLTELAKTYDSVNFTVQRPMDMFSCCL